MRVIAAANTPPEGFSDISVGRGPNPVWSVPVNINRRLGVAICSGASFNEHKSGPRLPVGVVKNYLPGCCRGWTSGVGLGVRGTRVGGSDAKQRVVV